MINRQLSFSQDLEENAGQAVNDSELPRTRGFARMCTCSCSLIPLAFSVIFGGLYAQMWYQANRYNNELNDLGSGNENEYDLCASLRLNDETVDTKWSFILRLNTLLYLGLTCSSLLVCVGTYALQLVIAGGVGHVCGLVAQVVIIAISIAFRFSDEGKSCALKND